MSNLLSIRGIGGREPVPLRKIHLHGAIVTPTAFIKSGTVVITGEKIAAVLEVRTPAGPDALDIDSAGLITPGFVDTHNHASYAAFRRWKEPARYLRGRFDWRGKTRCKVVVVPEPDDYYAKNVSKPFKDIVKDLATLASLTFFGQVRGVIGGATTMVIDADLDPDSAVNLPGFTRDPGDWPGRVWGILDVGCVEPGPLKTIVDDLSANKAKLLVHVGEGIDEFSRGEFLSLEMKGLLTSNTALIHALALLDKDWELVRERGASVIWSPRSNHRLYGRSIDIGQAVGTGIPIALAPDWTITGSSTVLDELAFVRDRYRWIGDERLLAMVTESAADIMGMASLGRIAPGALADVLVFPVDSAVIDRASAATRVVTSSHADLRLALVGGKAVFGVEELVVKFPDGGAATERLQVPTPSGGMVDRVLQAGPNGPFAAAIAMLQPKFEAQGLAIAPLWEPD